MEEHPKESRAIITYHESGKLTKSEEHSEIGFCKTQPEKMITDQVQNSQKK